MTLPKLRSTTHRRGSSTKPFFASASLMMEVDAFFPSRLRRLLAGIALICEGDLYRLTADMLHFLRQCTDLGTLLLVGGRDLRGRQVASVSTAMCTLLPFLSL